MGFHLDQEFFKQASLSGAQTTAKNVEVAGHGTSKNVFTLFEMRPS
jgi:hypothetical protein